MIKADGPRFVGATQRHLRRDRQDKGRQRTSTTVYGMDLLGGPHPRSRPSGRPVRVAVHSIKLLEISQQPMAVYSSMQSNEILNSSRGHRA
jgi:hypothetical protein